MGDRRAPRWSAGLFIAACGAYDLRGSSGATTGRGQIIGGRGGRRGGRRDADGDGDAGLTRRERRLLASIAEYLGFADLLALLMVSATAFTGYATWRTATIAHALFLSSERPYIGVKSVELNNSHPGDPRVEIEYQNFGHVSAESARVVRQLTIDARAVTGQTKSTDVGILSPEVPHHMHLHVPEGSYDAIVAGRSKLEAEVAATYSSPGREPMCYLERFTYTADAKQFEVDGGTTRCADLKALGAASRGSNEEGPLSDLVKPFVILSAAKKSRDSSLRRLRSE